MTNLGGVLKSKESHCDEGPYSQGYGALSSHVPM